MNSTTTTDAIAEITSASHDNAEHGERGIRILRDFQHLEYGTKLYAHPAPCLHQIQEPTTAEQTAWHAGLDEGRAQAAPAAVAVPENWKLVPVDLTPEMKREFMDLLMDGIDIYVNRHDQIEIQTDSPRRIWKAVLALSPAAPQAQADVQDADGEAFRTAARLGLTLRFYGNCAQSGAPGTPSVYEVTTGPDSAEAMRASIDRAAIAAAKLSGGTPAHYLVDEHYPTQAAAKKEAQHD